MKFFEYANELTQVVMDKDPASGSFWETLLLIPGVKAQLYHYFAHKAYLKGRFFLAQWLSQRARRITGIEIHPGARLGRRLFIDHGMGIVIGGTAIVGDDVQLFHGVTLGGTTSDRDKKRHPTVEDGVLIGAGATVLGNITIGKGAKIGAGAVVIKDVPPGATAVGLPARTLVKKS